MAILVPLLLLLLLGSLRGGVTNVAKYVGMQGVPALGYVFWQSCVAALVLLVVCLATGRPLPFSRHTLGYFLVCGIVGMALPNVLFFAVLRNVSAGSMAVVLVTIPLFTYAIAILMRMERWDAIRVVGITLGLCGALLMVMPHGGAAQVMVSWWLALGFVCPLLFAGASIYASRYARPRADSLTQAAGTMIAATLALGPAALLTGGFYPIWQGPVLVSALMLAHGAAAAAAYTLFFVLLRLAGPVFYSQSAYIVALTGIGFGMVFFQERHPPGFWLAVALIFAGLSVVNVRRGNAGSKP